MYGHMIYERNSSDMKYTLSEKKVLKKLGIKDFRHMTKDKVVKFASMLPYMNPEVAKKALEQFPSFKDLAGDMVIEYKAIVNAAFEENRISQKAFYDACNSILDSLKTELEDDEIDAVERDRIENKMIKVAGMIGEKDRENKGWLLKIVGGTFSLVVLGIATAAAILGANTHLSPGDNTLADNDFGDDDNIIDV